MFLVAYRWEPTSVIALALTIGGLQVGVELLSGEFIYTHRPAWLGRASRWLFLHTSRPRWLSPFLFGMWLGIAPHKMDVR